MIETGTDSLRLGQGYFVECISNILIQQCKFSRYFTVLRQHDMENKMNKSVDRTMHAWLSDLWVNYYKIVDTIELVHYGIIHHHYAPRCTCRH